ncbi:MAG: hypothetical protein OXU45_07635 [Candidatus Melainabacteria bacterium]|nr:hypothetical protein [Candidatus Melainabacteria bacterium]
MLDLQINGFATNDFECNFWACPEDEKINALNEYLQAHQVQSYLATLITASYDEFWANLKRIREYQSSFGRENLIGVHIEGALISRMGVHPKKHAQALNYQAAKNLLNEFGDLIKLWTLCPRVDEAGQVTRLAQDHGIVVSYGHSEANYDEAMHSFKEYEVNCVTHWGNAMYVLDDFKQRDCSDEDLARLDSESKGGLGLAAYQNDDVYCMAIAGSKNFADEHLDPRLLRKLFEKKPERMILVSDSVLAKPNCDKLQGGLTCLDQHALNAIEAGCDETAVIKACTENPKMILERVAH